MFLFLGGFRQTVLKKIENSVVPLFAGILSQIDVASNCSLLDSRNGSFQWQRNVFLELFGCKDLVDFRFQSPVFFSTGDYPQPLEKFSIAQLATVGFQCRFPFSWLLKTKIDEFLTTQEKIVRGRKRFDFAFEANSVVLLDLSNQNMKSHQEDMVIFIEQEDNMKSNTSPIADPDTILKQKPWGRVLVELSEDQLGHYLHDLVYWCFPTVTRRESEVK